MNREIIKQLPEKDKYLGSANLPKLNQEVNNPDRPIKMEEIETVIKSLPMKTREEVQGEMDSQ